VAAPGPFSVFRGVDRTLAVLDGPGLVLRLRGGEVRAMPSSAPVTFAGEEDVVADLLGAPVWVLNVMSRRTQVRHRLGLRPLEAGAPVECGADALLVLLRGDAVFRGCGGTAPLSAGDAVLIAGDGGVVSEDRVPAYVAEFWRT
jgi:environmental stress-induced protein Ves